MSGKNTQTRLVWARDEKHPGPSSTCSPQANRHTDCRWLRQAGSRPQGEATAHQPALSWEQTGSTEGDIYSNRVLRKKDLHQHVARWLAVSPPRLRQQVLNPCMHEDRRSGGVRKAGAETVAWAGSRSRGDRRFGKDGGGVEAGGWGMPERGIWGMKWQILSPPMETHTRLFWLCSLPIGCSHLRKAVDRSAVHWGSAQCSAWLHTGRLGTCLLCLHPAPPPPGPAAPAQGTETTGWADFLNTKPRTCQG